VGLRFASDGEFVALAHRREPHPGCHQARHQDVAPRYLPRLNCYCTCARSG
jgi:hypothetical protein